MNAVADAPQAPPAGPPRLPPQGFDLPWERMPRESLKAYAAFLTYCELGPGRTLTDAAHKLNKSRTVLGAWSGRWQWQLRIRSYDAEQQKIQRDADATAALEFARKNEGRRQVLRDKVWGIMEKCADKFAAMMNFPVAKTEIKNDADGTTTIIMPGPWRFGDAVRMAHAVQSLGAFSTGLTKGLPDPATGKMVDDEDDFDGKTPSVELPKITIEIRDTTGGQDRVVSEEFATQSPAALTKGENDGPSFKFGRA